MPNTHLLRKGSTGLRPPALWPERAGERSTSRSRGCRTVAGRSGVEAMVEKLTQRGIARAVERHASPGRDFVVWDDATPGLGLSVSAAPLKSDRPKPMRIPREPARMMASTPDLPSIVAAAA